MRKIIFALAFGALLLPDYGFTLGLGEIEVTTALNQELNAEIQLLSAAPEDVETLILKLASREEFIRAGIDRPYMLNSLKFSAETRDGVPFVRVTSDKPVREPFLSFLVEVDWPRGHMMREYTILLDPPVFLEQQAPAQQEQLRPAAMESSPPAARGVSEPQSSSGFRPAVMGATATTPSAAAAPAPEAGVQTTQAQAPYQSAPAYTQTYYQSPGGYRVQQGDTLWSLADAMRPDQSVSIEQMMLAMLRSNPEAFINENVNGLKRGYILRIPDGDDIVSINQDEAVAMVREQNALWREYYQAVAGGETASSMDREGEGSAGAGMDESGDSRLEIVAAGSGTSAAGAKDPTQMSSSELRAELALAREALETERVEKEELNQRVVSLEGQVDRMKSLLTLEDSDLAEMQQVATPVEGEAITDAGASEEAMFEELDEMVIDETAVAGDAVVEEITETEEVVIDESAVEEGGEQEVFIDEEQAEMVEELAGQSEASTEDFAVSQNTEPAFMQQRKQDPLTMLLNNPVLLAAAGGGLLLVLLLIALIMKRRKSGDEEFAVAGNLDDIDNITDQVDDRDVIREVEDVQVEQEMAEAEAVAETVSTGLDADTVAIQTSTEDTVAATDEAETESEPRDDVIAEADVYLAYGIYQQAEELLQNAIKDDPDKDSYRVKLAETYLAGKNSDGFVELATEMNQRRGGEDTPAWQRIVAIGQELVPGHALISAASAGDLLVDDEPASESPEPIDFDQGSEADQQAEAPALDLGFDESEAGIAEAPEEALASAESVEFDLSETGAEAATESEEGIEFGLDETQAFEAGQTTQEFSLDIEASELGIEDEGSGEADAGEFDLDLSAEAEEALAADDETEDTGITLDDVNEASLDFDTGDSKAAELDIEESQDESGAVFDLSETSMEEAVVEMVTEPETAQPESRPAFSSESMDDDLDLSDLDDVDEVSTKLDLAKAYLDMGDADGTRSILDEVMTEGNDDQKKEADDLLRQLG